MSDFSDFSAKRPRLHREEFGLMHPRRSTRRRRYSSGSRPATRRLLLIAAATSVPVLVVGYALTTGRGGRAVDTADVTGASLRSAYGHGSVDGGWGGAATR
jgi:hypothetical protein